MEEHPVFKENEELIYVEEDDKDGFDLHLEDAVSTAYIARLTRKQLHDIGKRLMDISRK